MESRKLADEVIIHGNNAKKTAVYYELPIRINRTIKLIGKYGIPVIIAKKGSLLAAMPTKNQRIKVTFISIKFQDRTKKDYSKTLMFLRDSSLIINNCSFLSIPKPVHLYCSKQCKLEINDSKIVSPAVGVFMAGNGKIFAIVTRTEFIGKKILSDEALVYGVNYWSRFAIFFELRIAHCKFRNFNNALRLLTTARKCRIAIRYSQFQDNFIHGPSNSQSPSVSVHYDSIDRRKPRIFLLFLASDCLFLNNQGGIGAGISFKVGYGRFYGVILNCTFKDNIASTTGGAVSLLREGTAMSKLVIQGSHFENNVAKNLAGCPPLSMLTYGSGGALSFASMSAISYSQHGDVNVTSCTFIANSADVAGGTIYTYLINIVLKSTKIITNVSESETMVDGTVLSIRGPILLQSVRIMVKNFKSHKSVLRFQGPYHFDSETSLACPVGTKLQGVLLTNNACSKFSSLTCSPCDVNQYNLHGSTISNATIDYIECLNCLPGAVCQNGRLKPVDNYWGYIDNKHGNLSLVQLPLGYGCSNKQCKRYDSCAENRQGTLCSTCIKGYSESMFSSKCVKNEYCNGRSFWAMAVALVIFYLIFFIYKKNLISFLKSQLLWFKRLDRRRNNELSMNEDQNESFTDEITPENQTRNPRDVTNTTESQSQTSAGLLKIIFYFYQIEALLDIYGGNIEHGMVKGTKSYIQSIISFNFLESSGSSACAMNDATPVIKVILRGIFVASVLAAFVLLYIIYRVVQYSKRRCCRRPSLFSTKHAFGDRVLAALFEVVLLSYAVITKIITSMLDCRMIGDKKVLFLQGNILCYQSWQYGIATAGLAWVVPFCIYINLLPNFIRSKQVSRKGLFLGCIFPIPVIMYYAIKKKRGNSGLENQQETSGCEGEGEENEVGTEQEACGSAVNGGIENENGLISIVQQTLCGPFKDKFNSSKYLSWDGVYIFRRLFIVSVFVFVEDATYKLYVLLAGQILILMHHSHVKPYNSKFLNFLESASLGFLVLINGMNLLSVYDFAHGISEVGDKLLLLKIFAWIETVLHLLVPTLIITSLAVLLIVRCFYIIFKILRYCSAALLRRCCDVVKDGSESNNMN